MVVDQVARCANNEKVTQVLVEDQLRPSPGIGACDDDGKRVLRLGRLLPTRCDGLALGYLTRGKTEIALLEFGERSIGGHRGSRRMVGQDESRDAQAGNGSKESKFGCGFHSWF